MKWIIAIIVGFVVGMIANYIFRADRRQNTIYSILMGVIGGLAGIWFFYDLIGLSASTVAANFWLAVLWSFVGSFLFAAIFDLIVGPSSDYEDNTVRGAKYDERSIAHDYDEMMEKRRKEDEDKNK